jgi:hypothetical protein
VILTGGLGPTDDDLTRDVVAAVFELRLLEQPDLVAALSSGFAARGLTMPAINRRQAMVPEGADIMRNEHGTAPDWSSSERAASWSSCQVASRNAAHVRQLRVAHSFGTDWWPSGAPASPQSNGAIGVSGGGGCPSDLLPPW